MDPFSPLAISAAGMNAERARADAAALNLANAHTSGEPGYQPVRAVVQAPSATAFARIVDQGVAAVAPRVALVPTAAAPRLVHEPGHPHADAKGFVAYPNVDTAAETLTLMQATRAYEANVAAIGAARAMAQKALEIGGGQ